MVGDVRALGLRLGGDSRTASFRLGRLCQRDDAAVSEGALSQFWSPPFTFLSDPLSPFFHPRSKAPSPVITKKRPHESQHSSHLPLGDPSENNTSLAHLTRRIQDAALYNPRYTPIAFHPNIYFRPPRAYSHSTGRNRTADCRAWAPCISAPNPPAHDTLDRPGAIAITRAAATAQRSAPPYLVLAYLTCDRARSRVLSTIR